MSRQKFLFMQVFLCSTLIILTSCTRYSDWAAYHFSSPREQTVIHGMKLEDRADELLKATETMIGWKPDFCYMLKVKEKMQKSNELYEGYSNSENFKDEFYKSFLRAFPQSSNQRETPQCGEKVEAPLPIKLGDVVKEKVLKQVDREHQGLLVGNDEYLKNKSIYNKWRQESKIVANNDVNASISVSVRKHSKNKFPVANFFLQTSHSGQQAIIDFAKTFALLEQQKVSNKDKQNTCAGEKCVEVDKEALQKLLKVLNPPESIGIEDFEPTQTIELTVSGVLNSPDIVNRFDYFATYLYVHPYPYPSNAAVSLEEEFWTRLQALQLFRKKEERQLSLQSDFDRVWQDMRVKIDHVDTTVLTSNIEIAGVTRVATESAKLVLGGEKIEESGDKDKQTRKLLPSAEINAGTSTSVTEKLAKQLDQRSVWLSPDRDILRITQRGSDTVNIAGAIREKATLKIPASSNQIHILGISDSKIKIKDLLSQPLYSRVPALAVSVAVSRFPFKFKRSATEKFGLPDSADAYLVVDVSPLTSFPQFWYWERMIGRLTLSDLMPTIKPQFHDQKKQREVFLRFYSPVADIDDYFSVNIEEGDTVLKEIKTALLDLINRQKNIVETNKEELAEQEKKELEKRENEFTIGFDMQERGKYYLLNGNKDDINSIWIGKEGEDHKIAPFECSDLPDIEKHFNENLKCENLY